MRALAEGRYGEVVVLQGGVMTTVPMTESDGRVRTVPPEDELVRTARGISIAFGDRT
jgi:hypothetical protein